MLDQQKNTVPLYLILIFFLLVIGIITSGYVFYEIQKTELKKKEHYDLSTVADLKVREIANWRKERLGDAQVVQQSVPAINRIRQFLENPSSVGIRKELLSWIKSLRESDQYGSVALLDRKKMVRLYWGDETRLIGSHTAILADKAMRTKQIVFSDFHWEQAKHAARLDIVVPLSIPQGHENNPVGVLLLRVDPRWNLYPIIKFWPTSSPSAETLLVRREGNEVVFLNELRHTKDTALTMRMPISNKQLPAAMAARGEEGMVEGLDYRDVHVLAAIKAVPDTPWYIIAKIDTEEIYAPLLERFWMVLILVCTLILLAGTATGLIWRHQLSRFYRGQYEAKLEREALTSHYEYLTKYANDIILMMDEKGRIVEANDRAMETYGYTRDELLQMNIRKIRDPLTLPDFPKQLEQIGKRNGFVYYTVHRRKDGTTIPVEVSSRAIVIEERKFYQSIIRDISERKQAEAALTDSERRYRRLFEAAKDGILIINADTGQIDDVNPFLTQLLGYSEDELLEKKIWEVGLFKDIADSKAAFENLQAKRYVCYDDLLLETKDGRRIDVEFACNVYRVDQKNVIQCNIRDISERKRAEGAMRRINAELAESEHHYRDLVQSANSAIIRWKSDGTITFFNEYARNFFGYSADELIGRHVGMLAPEKESTGHDLTHFAQDIVDNPERYANNINENICRDGRRAWMAWTNKPLLDDNGKVTEILAIGTDITALKQAEEILKKQTDEIRDMTNQLWQAAKLAMMGELTASIAHELNNPLATVSLRTESLLAKTQGDSPDRRELEIIEREVERMSKLIAGLLQFSRRDHQHISTVDVREEMEKTLELIFYHLRKNNIIIEREFTPDMPRIHADRQQLRQLFLNLFTNASDAMPRGGTLTIRVTAPSESKQIVIEVADTGVGIPHDILQRVWEPFYTTKPEGKGTGLGLAICRRIVQEHNGVLDLTSEGIPGKGATARISLPLTNGKNAVFLKDQ